MAEAAADRLRRKVAHLQQTVDRLTDRIRDLQRSERALRRTREHQRLLLDALPDLLFEIDAEGRISDFRAPQADLLYLQPEHFLGRRFRDVLPDHAAAVLDQAIERALEHGRDTGAIYDLDTPAGHHWFELSIAATPTGGRRKRRLIVLIRTITERQHARQEAQDARLLLEAILESVGDPITALGPDGRLVYANSAAASAAGFRSAADMIRDYRVDTLLDRYEILDEQGASVSGRGLPTRIALAGVDAGPVTAQFVDRASRTRRWVRLHARPAFDSLGRVQMSVGVTRDITAEREAEQALRRSEQRYRLISENTADVIWMLDLATNRFTYVSPSVERLRGFTPDEVLQQTPSDVVPPELRPEMARRMPARIAAFLAGDESARIQTDELDQLCKDGSYVPTEVVTTLLTNEAGEVTEIVGISRDISERRRAEQERLLLERQMLQAQKLESLGLLAGGVAHDFNNLLTAVLGNADLALCEPSVPDAVRRSLEEIHAASRRAADLCRQMLAYSGRGRFVVEPVDLSALVSEMAQMLAVSISKKAALQFDLGGGLPAVEADATQLRQIVMNLIVNASEAIGDHPGIVAVTTGAVECSPEDLAGTLPEGAATPGTYVFLDVSDSGSGMMPETMARIFDPFFTTKFTGRGLGLAAVLGIVRGHGGLIRVSSEPGAGSQFRVLLRASPTAARPEHREVAATPWRGSGTVLVVDDEEGVRRLAQAMLERLGFSVVLAADGAEAIERLRARPDGIVCVLLDLTMPRMDGRETCKALRGLAPGLPVILSSGYERQHVEEQFAGLDLAGFVQKPYQWTVLSEAVRKAVAGAPPGPELAQG